MKALCASYTFLAQKIESISWFPPLLARLSVGFVFVQSGWGKLHNLPKVIEFFASIGIPAPELQAPFVATLEFACGLLLVLGLFTRIASLPLIVIMLVAIKTAKMSDLTDWSDILGFSEYLYIVLLAWLLTSGAGCASLDRVFCRKSNTQTGDRTV